LNRAAERSAVVQGQQEVTVNKRAMGFAMSLLLGATTLHAEERTAKFYGYAYDLKTGHYLYTEVHEQRMDGERWLGGTMRYLAPDGSLIGDKTLDFSQDPYIPIYRLQLPLDHYEEGVTAIGPDRVDMEKARDGQKKTDHQKRVAGMAADSGFNSLLVDHFDDLAKGQTVKFTLLVAGQLSAYQFRAHKTADLQFDGQPALQLLVEPDSLLRIFVDPLTITYSKLNHHLLEYRGVSNVHDPATGSAYNVRIIYPASPPPDAPKNLPPL
jgi:hypothetical protein